MAYYSKKKGKGARSRSDAPKKEPYSRYVYHEPVATYRINDKRHNKFFGEDGQEYPYDGYRIKVEPFHDIDPDGVLKERQRRKKERDYWNYYYDRCCLQEQECRCNVDVRVKVNGSNCGSRPRRCPVHGIVDPWMEPYPPYTHRSWGSPHPHRCHRRRSSSYYDDVTCRVQFSPHVQFESPVVTTRFKY